MRCLYPAPRTALAQQAAEKRETIRCHFKTKAIWTLPLDQKLAQTQLQCLDLPCGVKLAWLKQCLCLA